MLATLLALQGNADDAGRGRDAAARSRATTTPIARTMKSAGSTGTWGRGARRMTRYYARASRRCAVGFRCSPAVASSTANGTRRSASRTSPGSRLTRRRWRMANGPKPMPAAWACCWTGAPRPPASCSAATTRRCCMILNAHHDVVEFILPEVIGGREWRLLVDTNLADETRIASRSSPSTMSMK